MKKPLIFWLFFVMLSFVFGEEINDYYASELKIRKGICLVLGMQKNYADELTKLVDEKYLIYYQSDNENELGQVRSLGSEKKWLGINFFAGQGDYNNILLTDNIVTQILIFESAKTKILEKELLRVLHPGGSVTVNNKIITKPLPKGIDEWNYPAHAADNNPISNDKLALSPYATQFIGYPKFGPMPAKSVIAGGKCYKMFGNVSGKSYVNHLLNTLLCINAYNGQVLWKRKLPKDFMHQRNTIIATSKFLYLADDKSCKLIIPETGNVKKEIIIQPDLKQGQVWKWMALNQNHTNLIALIGGEEFKVGVHPTSKWKNIHWNWPKSHFQKKSGGTPGDTWDTWAGYEYPDPEKNFGYGKMFISMEVNSEKILWKHIEDSYVDSRGVCMKKNFLYYYCPNKYLVCLNTINGKIIWKNDTKKLLDEIGEHFIAMRNKTGFSTTPYIICNDKYIVFSGTQRDKLLVIEADTGNFLWSKSPGNYYSLLNEDALYVFGADKSNAPAGILNGKKIPGQKGQGSLSFKLDYETGEILEKLPKRGGCTIVTGNAERCFYKSGIGATGCINWSDSKFTHISFTRPSCQDGIITSNGMIYWNPTGCRCPMFMYGHIALTSQNNLQKQVSTSSRLEYLVKEPEKITPSSMKDLSFIADENGIISAIDAKKKVKWNYFTGGAIHYPPIFSNNRLYAGSADGKIYCLEAKTGKLLWKFRCSPKQRFIPVYGKIISTWPVAGGVVVKDGIVYGAAGIIEHDTTYVLALNGITGEVIWENNTSAEKMRISLQGQVYIENNKICFKAGSLVNVAEFDIKTGKFSVKANYRRNKNNRYKSYFKALHPMLSEKFDKIKKDNISK